MLSYTTVISTSHPVCQIHYTDYKIDDIASKNEFIQTRREMKVESLVNDAEYDESKLPEYRDSDDVPTIGISLFSKSVSMSTYSGITKWQSWISELEKIALTEVATGGWNLNISLSDRNNQYLTGTHSNYSYDEYLQRSLISKTISGTSYIASVGRIGPGNVAFVGSNVIQYFRYSNYITPVNDINNSRLIGSVGGVDIVFCPEINPDRVIVFRGKANKHDPTLMLVEADFDDNRWAVVSCGKAYCISYDVTA